ncbi:MAG: M20/M25/M40 family metallo-hydrolase [Candidatus Aminicenantia bacterium]
MAKKQKFILIFILLFFYFFQSLFFAQEKEEKSSAEQILLQASHSISRDQLFNYVVELTSPKYGGRLTGTEEYNAVAKWVASLFQKWGLIPGGDKGTYFQAFPCPYTLVFEGNETYLHIPSETSIMKKYYQYEKEFIPGSTSGSGEVTAEVIYVGYGITAPELNYDDYQGMDAKGKIVLMEREVPISPDKEPKEFLKWRPYSFHQYKLQNAYAHGAVGMLYNYGPIANPNNAYIEDFIYTHVGKTVVEDLFAGTGRNHEKTVNKIIKTRKPQSFPIGKIFTIKNITEYHPEGIGYNVIGYIEGKDPELKEEVIIIGAHLDHVGRCPKIIPGANDNASGVAVLLGIVEAMTKCSIKPKRSIMFICFGAEEQGVVGSKFYLEHPTFPLEKTVGFINMDGVGCGDELRALAAKNSPGMWNFLQEANEKYIHRIVKTPYFSNIARPRLDAARFMWKGIPTISFSAFGARSYYHITKDTAETITPEIMEDLAKLIFLGIMNMINQDKLDFRKK